LCNKIKPLLAKAGRFSLRLKVICFEPLNKEPQNIEVKNIVLFLQKLLLFEIPCSIFKMQNRLKLFASEAKILHLANGKIKGQVTPMPSYFTGVPFGSFGSEHRS